EDRAPHAVNVLPQRPVTQARVRAHIERVRQRQLVELSRDACRQLLIELSVQYQVDIRFRTVAAHGPRSKHARLSHERVAPEYTDEQLPSASVEPKEWPCGVRHAGCASRYCRSASRAGRYRD